MTKRLSAEVLIIGAGPVGMTLALDLAGRGIKVIIVEQRASDAPTTPRANHISARAMETYRRLGVADEIRCAGLPGDFPPDIVWMTSMTRFELTRIQMDNRDTVAASTYRDPDWPTPEPQHKINQMYLEPILRRHVIAHPNITALHNTQFIAHEDMGDHVLATLNDNKSAQTTTIETRFMIGCDGGNSGVRKAIGAKFEGDPVLTRVVSLHLKSPDLLSCLPGSPAHRYFVVNERQNGSVVCLDGKELWSFHVMLNTPEDDPQSLDYDAAIRAITGIDDPDFSYDIFQIDPWVGRRLLADKFREGRVFLCGDAAHIWVPNAGYGMNAGIADAENLAWHLAAVLQGWGGSALLDDYERERHPITDQISNVAKDLAVKNSAPRFKKPPSELEDDTAEGHAARARFGAALHEINLPQFKPLGLNFAYFYDRSASILYDGEQAPSYDLGTYTPSTVPGCRLPHLWLEDGASLYDRLGPGFTLIRRSPRIDSTPLAEMAKTLGVPLDLVDIDKTQTGPFWTHDLVLVRPDRHIAWRGQSLPNDLRHMLETLTGRTSH